MHDESELKDGFVDPRGEQYASREQLINGLQGIRAKCRHSIYDCDARKSVQRSTVQELQADQQQGDSNSPQGGG